VLLIGLLGGGYYYYYYPKSSTAFSATDPDSANVPATPDDTSLLTTTGLDSSVKNTKSDTLSLASTAAISDTVVHVDTALPEGNLEIIIASFRQLAEAEEYVAIMHTKGYVLRILHPNRQGNRFKV